MRIPSSVSGLYGECSRILRTHRVLALIMVGLFVAAGAENFVRANLTGDPAVQLGAQTYSDDYLRTCSGMHTVFADFETIAEAQELYVEEMSAVFSEHESILRTPSLWKCGAGQTGEPNMPRLQNLAAHLSGWNVFPSSGAPAVQRPVSFTAFSAVVAEFQREYECKLVELQDRAIYEISRNKDRAPDQFCCTNQGCIPAGNGSLCTGPQTSDSMCNQQCPILFTTVDLATRIGPYDVAINNERQRSRTALERSLYALRSPDIHYEVARQLTCYIRASLDLRNELNLTADAISCMPKIWDALTSIHDKKRP